MGRRIFENLRKAMIYILAIYVPIAFIAMTAGNLGLVRVNDPRVVALLQLFHKGHAAFLVIPAAACLIVTICIVQPTLAELFQFAPPDPGMQRRQQLSESGQYCPSTSSRWFR
jgi:hypothetical protein